MELEKACYICGSNRFVDDHHYDCREGRLSSETVPLCRRCHRTYHNFGVDWFDDEYLDKAIEVENKAREIHAKHNIKGQFYHPDKPIMREDVKRSDYWNKIHGIHRKRRQKERSGEQLTLPFVGGLKGGSQG